MPCLYNRFVTCNSLLGLLKNFIFAASRLATAYPSRFPESPARFLLPRSPGASPAYEGGAALQHRHGGWGISVEEPGANTLTATVSIPLEFYASGGDESVPVDR